MDIHTNRVKVRLKEDQIVLGVKVDLASPDIVEMVGVAGYDFVWIDCEHSSFYLETAVHMIRAADAVGVTPIVRVPSHEPSFIMRILDAGAMGIIVPNIASASGARDVVAAAKYQTARTEGKRGACPRIRASGHQANNWTKFAEWSNDNTMIWLLVESPEGAEQIDEIVAVPGVDAIMLGAFDLSVAMGYPGEKAHPKVVAKLDEIIVKTLKRNVDVVAVISPTSLEDMVQERQRWTAKGCRILNVMTDRRLIAQGLKDTLAAYRT